MPYYQDPGECPNCGDIGTEGESCEDCGCAIYE